MMAPPLLFLAGLVGYPLVYGILLSLQDRAVAKPGHFVGAKLHHRLPRPDLLAGRGQYRGLYRCGDIAEDGRRARPRAGDEPALPREKPGAGAVVAAVHRADGTEHSGLDVDARSRLQRRQPAPDRDRCQPAGAVLAWQPGPRDVFDHHDQYVGGSAILRHHTARRAADRAAGTL